MKRVIITATMVLLLAAIAVAAPQPESESAEVTEQEAEMVRDVNGRLVDKPQYGGTINLFDTTNSLDWDPWFGLGTEFAANSVLESLTIANWAVDRGKLSLLAKYIPESHLRGNLAESWDMPDPLTYIIHVRQGVMFQDKAPVNGRELTADDMKYSIDRQLGQGEFVEDGASPYGPLNGWVNVQQTDVIDKYTVKITMKEAQPNFVDYWGGEIFPRIIPRELVDTYGGNWTWEQTCGTGPWMPTDAVEDSSYTMAKHPSYWGVDELHPENQIPYADAYKVLVITDVSTQVAAMRTGKIDKYNPDYQAALDIMGSNPEILYAKMPGMSPVVNLNVAKEPYGDIRVRRAMQMAINLQELNDAFYQGEGDSFPYMWSEQAFPDYYTPLSELSQEAQETFTWTNENVAKAKALLTEAGYPDGFTQVLPMAAESDLINAVFTYWEAIGITTEYQIVDNPMNIYSSGDQTLSWFFSTGNWYPQGVLAFWSFGQETTWWNLSNVDDPIFNDYYDGVGAEEDLAKRTALYKEAFAYGTEQIWYAATPTPPTYVMWQPWLKSYHGEIRLAQGSEGIVFARAWIDQELKSTYTNGD